MQILECRFEKEINDDEYISGTEHYAKGVNYEAYQMLLVPKEENYENKEAFKIWRRILDNNGTRVESLCPSLKTENDGSLSIKTEKGDSLSIKTE